MPATTACTRSARGGLLAWREDRYGFSSSRQRLRNLSLLVLDTVGVLSSLTFEPLTELSSVLRDPGSPVLKGPSLGLSFSPVKICLERGDSIGDLETV